jgi:hypothetical protein
MPRFTVGFGGVDPFRVAEQIKVVALFYAGVAYSMGALASSHNLLGKFLGHSRSVQPEPEQEDEQRSPLNSELDRLPPTITIWAITDRLTAL